MKLINCNLDVFIDRIKDKELVLFGAGKAAEFFCQEFSKYNLERYIKCFVDNDHNKSGGVKRINNTIVKIISVNDMLQKLTNKTVILITCADYLNIYDQIDSIPRLNNTECYIYKFILSEYYYNHNYLGTLPTNLRISTNRKIPKTIHYCWFGNNPIPKKNKEWMESWKKYCPDYEIIEWNENNYDISKNKYMKQAYECKKWGFVPDYARLDIIYNYGGIYLDTDVELIRNPDDFLFQDGFCGFENRNIVALGLGFGARKDLAMIRAMRDFYDELEFINEYGELNLTASPTYQTKVLKSHGLITNGNFQIVKGLSVYPLQMLCGYNMYTRETIITDSCFSIHHYDGSWLNQNVIYDQRRISKLYKSASHVN